MDTMQSYFYTDSIFEMKPFLADDKLKMILIDSWKYLTQNVLQKLNFMHSNSVREKWKLSVTPEEYRWSSAKFYESGIDEFGIITDYRL